MDISGVKVLDFTQLLPGPFATQLLADMGAEVIKIERPDGGDTAREMPLTETEGALFTAVNSGKKSITLDLKDSSHREVLYELVETADVVVEQFQPGVADRLGIDYETLTEYQANLVYCSLSAYGQTGPKRDTPGHDLTFAAETGLLDLTRSDRDSKPALPGFQIGDMVSGLTAATSILAAVLERALGNGSGRRIDIGMAESLLACSQHISVDALQGASPAPGETALTGRYPCYDIYETADGRYIAVAALEPHFWENLCTQIERPELIDKHLAPDPAVRTAVRETLASEFAAVPLETWTERLGSDTMTAPVRTIQEALEQSQFRDRGMVLDDHDGAKRLGFPAQSEPPMDTLSRATPALGEHTEEVLSSLDSAVAEDLLATYSDDG